MHKEQVKVNVDYCDVHLLLIIGLSEFMHEKRPQNKLNSYLKRSKREYGFIPTNRTENKIIALNPQESSFK